MAQFLEKLMKRWGVTGYGKLVLILLIFSVTGISTLFVKELFFGWMGIGSQTETWIRIAAWVITVIPAYQVLFLFFGFLFGQFDFVWRFEKKSANRIKGLFVKSE